MLTTDENAKMLSDFDLAHNQAKVHIAIAKLSVTSVSQVSKLSKCVEKTSTEHRRSLKNGLDRKILETPTRIRAMPVEEALSVLIKREQDIANRGVPTLMAEKEEMGNVLLGLSLYLPGDERAFMDCVYYLAWFHGVSDRVEFRNLAF